jgi:hypothetical protein
MGRDSINSAILYIYRVSFWKIYYSPLCIRLIAGWIACCSEPTDQTFHDPKEVMQAQPYNGAHEDASSATFSKVGSDKAQAATNRASGRQISSAVRFLIFSPLFAN